MSVLQLRVVWREPGMNRATRIAIFSASFAIFCYAGIGHVLGRTPDDKSYKSMLVYSEVLQKIQQDYVDEPDMHLVTAGSLRGLLESLDPESSYLTPREYAEYKQKLRLRHGDLRPAGEPRRKSEHSQRRHF